MRSLTDDSPATPFLTLYPVHTFRHFLQYTRPKLAGTSRMVAIGVDGALIALGVVSFGFATTLLAAQLK